MPLELGGVVDTRLRVYGTKSLRIVDAGIFPLVPAAHLQAPVYAAADIVKADHLGLAPVSCGTDSSFARPGPGSSMNTTSTPTLTSRSSSIKSTSDQPTASTLPESMNASILANLTGLWDSSSVSQAP
ncbi:hypothetical protein B2J93_9250 [Marssonina coronariae]|uniref:Glucose-methanol-choline oxidoreductase C-terminal domain-containing protein n=1 Tax=Diplocarpon coronariae TaxID=2795749 RepID=A0A218ZEM8_9HELO|nr:hypothetical protein B2J93_9250 [Marssonina coronariae]